MSRSAKAFIFVMIIAIWGVVALTMTAQVGLVTLLIMAVSALFI